MSRNLERFLWGLFSYKETLYFLGLKSGQWPFWRNGYPYQWGGDIPHTLIFLIICAINSLEFLFILKWKTRILD